jgi:hypothetical protein
LLHAYLQRPPRLDWAQLHQRTFGTDVLQCPCGGRRSIRHVHSTRKQAEARLTELGVSLPSPVLPQATAACGDQVIACTPGMTTVAISGLTTTGLGAIPEIVWALDEADFQAFAGVVLQSGLQLHFNNWAVTSLGAMPGSQLILRGTSTLMPDGTSACSPTTPPLPPEPPTRGLITTRTRRGHGELYTRDGWVKPFFVEAELSTDFHSGSDSIPLVSEQWLPVALDNAIDNLGREFPPIRQFDVAAAQTRLKANIRQTDCWRKEATVQTLLKLPHQQVATWGGRALKEGEFEGWGERRIQLQRVLAIDPPELRKAMKTFGLDCGSCEGWSRIQAEIMDRKDRPFGPPETFPDLPMMEPGPWSLEVFIEANLNALEPYLSPFQKCAEEGGEKLRQVAGQRIYSMPRVEVFDTMFDSARVESGSYKEVGQPGDHAAWSLEASYRSGVHTFKVVQLLEACLGHRDACWESALVAPASGFVWVDAATSNTNIPRAALTTAMSGGTVPAYGSRNRAVQGYFDRSRVELYTAIPQIYVDSGVSAAGFDYRGGSMLDWRHDSAFPEPDEVRGDWVFRHTDGAFDGWLDPHGPGNRRPSAYTAYRADWETDAVRVSRGANPEGLSYCALPENLSIDLDTIGFTGAGLAIEKLVPANAIFQNATSPVSVVNINSRWGRTLPALSP